MKLVLISLLAVGLYGCGPTFIETDVVGKPGKNGVNGQDGKDGKDGASCEVSEILPGSTIAPNGGALISCPGSTVVVYNGTNGVDGADGQDGQDASLPPTSIVAVIDPCGDAPGIYDEVLLKLQDGNILASFSQNQSGLNTRFSLLSPGSYQTTDGTSCVFTVNSDMSVTW